MNRFIALLTLSVLLLVACATAELSAEERFIEETTSGAAYGYGTTRDEITGNRARRKRQLRNLINDMRQKLADHSAGEIVLDPEEKTKMERRMDIYQRKLDTMSDDLDERVGTHATTLSCL
jgi:hypothetical protein